MSIVTSTLNENANEVNSFILMPPKNIEYVTDFAQMDITSIGTKTYTAYPGIRTNTNVGSVTCIGSIEQVIDKDSTTGISYTFESAEPTSSIVDSSPTNFLVALQFDLPEIDFDYDGVYLGISGKLECVRHMTNINIRYYDKKFYIDSTNPINLLYNNSLGILYSKFDSIPDNYYEPLLVTNDYCFRTEQKNIVSGNTTNITGYTTFAISPLKSKAVYNLVSKGAVLLSGTCYTTAGYAEGYLSGDRRTIEIYDKFEQFSHASSIDVLYDNRSYPASIYCFNITSVASSGNPSTIILQTPVSIQGTTEIHVYISCHYNCATLNLNELCYIFRKKVSLGDALYTSMNGRRFGDTWAKSSGVARKTPGDAILTPVEILEHLKRLNEQGTDYISNPQILIGDIYGSFDGHNGSLDDINNAKPAFQVFDKDKATKEVLVRDLCETFFMVNYQNKDGRECVKPLLKKEEPDSKYTITLAHIIGNIDNVVEPDTDYIYCEPYINYNYNYATDKFDSQIAITNIDTDADNYNVSYLPGIPHDTYSQGTAARLLWTAYHDLYVKYGVANKPPSNITDKYMIRRPEDAISYLKNLLTNMQLKRISFSIPYIIDGVIKPNEWELMEHFYINFPHQTNGNPVEVAIESITKDKKSNKVSVTCIILDDLKTTVV